MERRIRNILVPVDFSKVAQEAILYAARLAKALEASVHIVHVIDVEKESIKQKNKRGLCVIQDSSSCQKNIDKKQLLSWLPKLDVPIFLEVSYGDLAKKIKQYSREKYIDLIVVGKRIHQKNEDCENRSITEELIAQSDIPVLSVKEELKQQINQIYILADEDIKRNVYLANSMQTALKVPLSIVAINFSEQQKQDLKTLLKGNSVQNYRILFEESHQTEVLVQNLIGAEDILLLSAYGKTAIQRFLFGCLTCELIRYSSFSVLANPSRLENS